MTTLRSTKYQINLLLLTFLLAGCFQSDYTKLVKQELARGVREDSVLLGINFGDTRDEFYGRCFDLNQQRLVTDGGRGFVQYIIGDSVTINGARAIRFLFHPNFDNKNRLAEMFIEMSYIGWTPVSPAYRSDTLLVEAKALFNKWYGGNDFVTANVDEEELIVKLDANRRVLVDKQDAQVVRVKIQDILHPIFRHSITTPEKKGENHED